VGSTETARPKGPKSEAQKAEREGVLVEGMSPSPSARGLGERCKLPQWGPGDLAFYRLTKPLYVSILLIMAAL